MRAFPYPDAGSPDLRSPARFLWWLARAERGTLLAGVVFGSVWTACQALTPFVLGSAVDQGIVAGNFSRLTFWVVLLVGLTLVQAASATLRHRTAVSSWMQAAYRSAQLVGYKVTRSGDALPQKFSTGEVVSTSASDAMRIGEIYDVCARLAGSVVGYLLVTFLVFQTSWQLGLVVLLGVPLCGAMLLFVIRPLQRRQKDQREAAGKMTALGADTVAGLRVLRGIGGEHIFVERYRERSRETQLAGNKVAYSLADLDAVQVLVVGAFSVAFTWIGALQAVSGQIEAGQLVALYGYAVFLVSPIRTAADAVSRFIRAHVGARRIIDVLATPSAVHDAGTTVPGPSSPSALVDSVTGVVIAPGTLSAVVSGDPAQSADLARRLGRFEDAVLREAQVRWGEAALHLVPLREVRSRIVVSDAEPQLFTGTLREELDPAGRHSDAEIMAAIEVASAADVFDGLEHGLDDEVTEKGRSFSGGQRQRLTLARAMLTDAEVLVLIEPTSAVDAHTESRIATALRRKRGTAGSTTVVVTASPLLLGAMDTVTFLENGTVRAQGTHRELLDSLPAYRRVVIRGEGMEGHGGAPDGAGTNDPAAAHDGAAPDASGTNATDAAKARTGVEPSAENHETVQEGAKQ
ncbi:multidrug ABC transporter permease [Arthrobacter livingstonensis]|uniref:Multidrug ABC transporter permease n=1 Tax=Arthrobacter livingstonensis TaxID=670078 RepID=A0A2V5LZT1_9MICC|nr:ABC transporter ATP-binding protein [Arthrobacter livingstonensis]PYI69627.1 multidrug ABC transporter permease [Arthrobacter livingstonensis]